MDNSHQPSPRHTRTSWWLPTSRWASIGLILIWSALLALNLLRQPWPPDPARLVLIALMSAFIVWIGIGLLILIRRERARDDGRPADHDAPRPNAASVVSPRRRRLFRVAAIVVVITAGVCMMSLPPTAFGVEPDQPVWTAAGVALIFFGLVMIPVYIWLERRGE